MQRDLDLIEQTIFDRAQNILNENWHELMDGFWTLKLNEMLILYGRELGFRPYCSDLKQEKCNDWLWDIIWSKEERSEDGRFDWKQLNGLSMICEIEWSNHSEILTDFQKLIVGRADHKIMIVTFYSEALEQNFESIKTMCEHATMRLEPQNSKYLLIALPYYEADKHFIGKYAWTY